MPEIFISKNKNLTTINLTSIEYDKLRKAYAVIGSYLGCRGSLRAPRKVSEETANMCLDRDKGMLYREIAKKYYPNQYSQGLDGEQTATDRVKKRILRAKKGRK